MYFIKSEGIKMRRFMLVIIGCVVALIFLSHVALATTNVFYGKAPAPSKLINAERTAINEESDGFIYSFYKNSTEADWEYLKKIFQYTGFIPAEEAVKGQNHMYYAYNVEAGTVSMVVFEAAKNGIITSVPKGNGVLNDNELELIIENFEKKVCVPEKAKDCSVYPNFQKNLEVCKREQGVHSDENLFDGREHAYERYREVALSKITFCISELIALGYDARIHFSENPLVFFYVFEKEDAEISILVDAAEVIICFEPGFNWYELKESVISRP
jgi:hypothetical protein